MTVALDPNEYEEPKRFLPERFLNEDLNKPLAGHWSFGMGRRGISSDWVLLRQSALGTFLRCEISGLPWLK